MQDITIIGTGFAALTAIRTIRKKYSKDLKITVIAPSRNFIYLPSLIWIPSGLRDRKDLSIDLNNFLQRYKVNFHQAKVTGLSDDGRTVLTDAGEIHNDGLIIASGARFLKKLPGIEHAITICEGMDAAEKMRDNINNMQGGTIALGFAGNPKEPSAMRGGPMFEILFGLDTLLRKQKRRDKFKLVFFNPAPEPGKRLGAKAVKAFLDEMQKRQISTHLGHKLKAFTDTQVITEGGEISADLILFMPGMTGPAWLSNTDLPMSAGGMIKADQHCRVDGMKNVYVAGDSGSFPGPDWMPKQAHMADLQAVAAVDNLMASLQGKPVNKGFKVELACIVDSLEKGILVYRTEQRTLLLDSRLLHWAKRFFEWFYLRQYR